MENEDKEYTYVFEPSEEMSAKPESKPSEFRRRIWQIFPSVCGSTVCLPFGVMLGWPSPTYPTLIDFNPHSPVPISIDQSAMVAGFLMIGNTVATPLSAGRRLGAKYGLVVASALITVGWILMWRASDIYWLLASRFLIGAGYGYGVGQLKHYIGEMCQPALARTMAKQINLYVFAGVVAAFAYGPFVDFRQFSIIAMILSILVLFLAIFLPSTPRELVRGGRTADARRLLAFLNPQLDVGGEVARIKEQMAAPPPDLTFCAVMKKAELRKNFFIFAGLVFFQQFSGIPATIVYSQIIFERSGCPEPRFCALFYACVYFLANAYGIFCVPNHNKKHVILFSTVGVSLVLVVKILVLVAKVNELWGFSSVVVLTLFNVVHTVGLGSVPFGLIPELFPKEANKVAVHFFVMFHSMLALTITKIFQVMLAKIDLFAPFCLFLTVSTFSIIYVIVFVPNKKNDTSA